MDVETIQDKIVSLGVLGQLPAQAAPVNRNQVTSQSAVSGRSGVGSAIAVPTTCQGEDCWQQKWW